MIIEDETGITKLPVKFKKPTPEDRTLVAPWEVGNPPKCGHLMTQYLVCEREEQVTCGRCGERLNAMWVLSQLAIHDRRMAESQARHQDETKRLAERSRTKCEHCKKMTRISRA